MGGGGVGVLGGRRKTCPIMWPLDEKRVLLPEGRERKETISPFFTRYEALERGDLVYHIPYIWEGEKGDEARGGRSRSLLSSILERERGFLVSERGRDSCRSIDQMGRRRGLQRIRHP